MKKLRINPMVVEDLTGIRDYFGKDNPDAAVDIISGIYKQFEILRHFPEIGSDLNKRVTFETDLKYAVHEAYVIVYCVSECHVEIYRVLNQFQDFLSALFF